MMYIGTSLSGCLLSLDHHDVQLNEVLCIITSTRAEDLEGYRKILLAYCGEEYSARGSRMWKMGLDLWNTGRIHQPRLTADVNGMQGGTSYMRKVVPELQRGDLWLHVLPMNSNATPAVVEAWNHYKLLNTLTK